MIKIKKFLLPLLGLLLITGCGKKDIEVREELEEETETSSIYTQIEYIPGISFPVYTKDYEADHQFDKVLLSSVGDPFFFGMVKEEGECIASNYDWNKEGYQTPYLFGATADDAAIYNYPTYSEVGYNSSSLSFTDRQFELYDKEEYLYEIGIPTSRSDDLGKTDLYRNTPSSIVGIDSVEEFATIIDSVSFIHIKKTSITSDLTDISSGGVFKKYTEARFETLDNTTLYGAVVAIEFEDRQFFYAFGRKEEPEDISGIIEDIDINDTELYEVFKETERRTDKKTVSFDINGIAGEIEVPGYFRSQEISNNIYSSCLTFIPEQNRGEDSSISQLPNSYGSSEVFLKNEYLNTAITFNNLYKNEYMTNEADFITYYFSMLYFAVLEDQGKDLASFVTDYGLEEEFVKEREKVTDKDGNVWNSYLINGFLLYGNRNHPQVVPYGKVVLIYTREVGDYIEMFTVSCGLDNWYYYEELLKDFDRIPASFTETTAGTEKPTGPLTFYYQPSNQSLATDTDAVEGSEEPTTEYQEEATTEVATEATTEAVTEAATEAPKSDKDILEDLGITQDDIDNAEEITE